MDAGNQTLLKKNNQRAIVDYIIKNGPISRADLSKRLKISKPTVSANILELLEMNLLKEIGLSETDIGKKPMLIDFNKEYRYVLVIDLFSYIMHCQISVAVCNLFCEPLFIDSIRVPFTYGSKDIMVDLPHKLDEMFHKYNIDVDRIERLVLTAPSSKYDDDYIPMECTNGDHLNLADVFRERFAGKMLVKNDVNLAALGEKYSGVGKEYDNLAFFWAGLRVGGGIILNGELYEGKSMSAGEIAECLVYNDTVDKHVFLPEVLSLKGVEEYIQAHREEAAKSEIAEQLLSGHYYLDLIAEAAKNGDEFCVGFARFAGRTIAPLLLNLAFFLDLQCIIVGGEYTAFGDLFLDEIRQQQKFFPYGRIQVLTPQYSNSAMYGAFRLGADSIIANLI